MSGNVETCPQADGCIFGNMSSADAERFISSVTDRAVKRSLESLGLASPDAAADIKELIFVLKSYRAARATTRGWFIRAIKALKKWICDVAVNFVVFASKVAAILLLILLLIRFGVPPENIEKITGVLTK